MEIRSSNPVLSNKFWSNLTGTDRMTVEGSMKKIGYLLALTVVSALVSAVLCMNALNNGYTNARSRINTAALIAFADQDDRVHPRQDRRYGILHGRSPGACRDYGVSGTH